MKKIKVVPIKMTIDEYRYAMALSKRVPGCPRPNVGSVAHGLKWCLKEHAKREGLQIFE